MGQTFLNWNTLFDSSGNTLGGAGSGQVFDLGDGKTITATWSGDWTNGGPQPYSFADALNGVELRANQGDSVSVTFTLNYIDSWFIESQRNNTGIDNRDGTGELTADGIWQVTNINTMTDLTGDKTTILTYNSPPTGGSGDFDANFTGTTFTYDYNVQTGFGAPSVHDSFRFGLSQVPEPSSALLLGFGALTLVSKRRR